MPPNLVSLATVTVLASTARVLVGLNHWRLKWDPPGLMAQTKARSWATECLAAAPLGSGAGFLMSAQLARNGAAITDIEGAAFVRAVMHKTAALKLPAHTANPLA